MQLVGLLVLAQFWVAHLHWQLLHPGAAYNSLLAYSIGLGIPFLITGAFFSQATGIIRRMVKYLKYFNPAMGAVLIVLGYTCVYKSNSLC